MADPVKADRFIIANEKGLCALPGVLRKHMRSVRCNVYSGDGRSFGIGWDDKPDSDWGRYKGTTMRVMVAKEQYAAPVEAIIRKALGWPEEGGIFTGEKGND